MQGDLLKVSNDTGVQGYYAYDGLGRRVEAKEGSSTTWYAYLGTEVLLERFPSLQDNDYLYAAGRRIARIVCSACSSPSTYYYQTDALGSTRLITNSTKTNNANVVFADNYQPYGQDNGTPTGSETYKFTGKPVSQTTGLYYEYHRWYDPSVGRFISPDFAAGDLSNPESLNQYVYVSNSPVSYTDPSGQEAISILKKPTCSGDFWQHLWCSFTNPKAILASLEFTPVGVVTTPVDIAVDAGVWLGPAVGGISLVDVAEAFVPAVPLGLLAWRALSTSSGEGNMRGGGVTTGIFPGGPPEPTTLPTVPTLPGVTGQISAAHSMTMSQGDLVQMVRLRLLPRPLRSWTFGFKLCGAVALAAGPLVYVGEDLQSALGGPGVDSEQNRPDPEGIITGSLVGCLGLFALLR